MVSWLFWLLELSSAQHQLIPAHRAGHWMLFGLDATAELGSSPWHFCTTLEVKQFGEQNEFVLSNWQLVWQLPLSSVSPGG